MICNLSLSSWHCGHFSLIYDQLLVLGFAALSITLTFYGIGYHQYTVPLKILADMQYVCVFCYKDLSLIPLFSC